MFFFSTHVLFSFYLARSDKAPIRWARLFAFPKQTGKTLTT